jgi:hypothetical protein
MNLFKFIYNALIVYFKEWASAWKSYIMAKIDGARIRRAVRLAMEWSKNDHKTYYILRDPQHRPIPCNNFAISELKKRGVIPKYYGIWEILHYCLAVVSDNPIIIRQWDEIRRTTHEKELLRDNDTKAKRGSY